MKNWTLTFWSTGHAPVNDGQTFGCASHGIATADFWRGPEEVATAGWLDNGVRGEVLSGTYATVLAQLEKLAWKPAAAIVLFSQAVGMETFLKQWQDLLPGVPVAGGGAARGAGQVRGELLPTAEEVAVLLLAEGTWRTESLNVHEHGRGVEFRATGLRTLTHLREDPASDWVAAADYFRICQAGCGRAEGDCESITFSDVGGRNVHVSFDGDRLNTGADLPADGRLVLRTVTRPEVAGQLAGFCATPNALVFGCAGLRGLLDAPLTVAEGTLASFMFGELVTLNRQPQFGNLMASRLMRES